MVSRLVDLLKARVGKTDARPLPLQVAALEGELCYMIRRCGQGRENTGSRESEYNLQRWKERSGSRWHRKRGYRGSLGEFGRVAVETSAQPRRPLYGTGIRGESVPPGGLQRVASWDKPSLLLGQLTVAGEGVPLRRNRWALSKQGRALRFEVAGRTYRYYATSPRHRHRALAREGMEIETLRPRRGEGESATVSLPGHADATYVALALVMCGVNTRNLTQGGAVRTFFNRVLPTGVTRGAHPRPPPTPNSRAISIRWTSLVPSPISRILESRHMRATGYSFMKP